MAFKIQSTKVKEEEVLYVNAVIYGEAGLGKTTLASTLDNVLILSAEGGLLTLAEQDIPVSHIESLNDCIEAYNWLLKGEHEFSTVFIDSLSEIAQIVLEKYKGEEKDPRHAYGRMGEEIIALIRKFKKLPMNVVFIAKLERSEDAYNNRMMFRPSFPGQMLVQETPYQVDFILAMKFHKHEGKMYRVLQAEPNIQWTAKNRGGKLDELEKPNLKYLFEKITKFNTEKTEEK